MLYICFLKRSTGDLKENKLTRRNAASLLVTRKSGSRETARHDYGSVLRLVALSVAPPAAIHGERDYGLYCHCLGVCSLSSCHEV